MIEGRIKLILYDVVTKEIEETPWIKNLITTAMKTAISNQLRGQGNAPNPGVITYGAVGTDDTAPDIADVALGTEIERVTVSYTEIAGTTVTIRCFFNTSEGNGTLKEFGWFGEDATGAADSGTLFNHVAINKVKTNTKTLTVVQEFNW